MQAVKQPMGRRGQNDADIGDKGHAAENGIGRWEQLATHVGDLYHRPHAAEDHRRIMNGIDPCDVRTIVITQHPDGEANQQYDWWCV